jgi:hypothetical protein
MSDTARATASAPPPADPFVDHAFRRADEWGRQIGRCVGAMKVAIEDLEAISGDRHPLIICAERVLRDALADIGEAMP